MWLYFLAEEMNFFAYFNLKVVFLLCVVVCSEMHVNVHQAASLLQRLIFQVHLIYCQINAEMHLTKAFKVQW